MSFFALHVSSTKFTSLDLFTPRKPANLTPEHLLTILKSMSRWFHRFGLITWLMKPYCFEKVVKSWAFSQGFNISLDRCCKRRRNLIRSDTVANETMSVFVTYHNLYTFALWQVIEMKKIQSNVQIGNILLKSRNYIKARPQVQLTVALFMAVY